MIQVENNDIPLNFRKKNTFKTSATRVFIRLEYNVKTFQFFRIQFKTCLTGVRVSIQSEIDVLGIYIFLHAVLYTPVEKIQSGPSFQFFNRCL